MMSKPPHYEVTFYRTVLDEHGMPCKSVLACVPVHRAGSSEDAIAEAKRRFEQEHRLSNWSSLAEGYDLEVME